MDLQRAMKLTNEMEQYKMEQYSVIIKYIDCVDYLITGVDQIYSRNFKTYEQAKKHGLDEAYFHFSNLVHDSDDILEQINIDRKTNKHMFKYYNKNRMNSMVHIEIIKL